MILTLLVFLQPWFLKYFVLHPHPHGLFYVLADYEHEPYKTFQQETK